MRTYKVKFKNGQEYVIKAASEKEALLKVHELHPDTLYNDVQRVIEDKELRVVDYKII